GPEWSWVAASISAGSTSTPTTWWPRWYSSPERRPGPHPASSTRAARGSIASIRRASPVRSAPSAAIVRKRSMYHWECPSSVSVNHRVVLGMYRRLVATVDCPRVLVVVPDPVVGNHHRKISPKDRPRDT